MAAFLCGQSPHLRMPSVKDDDSERESCWERFLGMRWVQEESAHGLSLEGLVGAQRHHRQHHCSSSALPLSNSVSVSGEMQDSYSQEGMVVEFRWKCEDGCNGQHFCQFPGSYIL